MACIKDWKGDLASFDNIIDNPGLRNLDGFLGSLEANFWIGLRKMWWVWANSGNCLMLLKSSVYNLLVLANIRKLSSRNH